MYRAGGLANLEAQIARLRADPTDESAALAVRILSREARAFQAYATAFADRALALAERGEVEGAIRAHVEAALVFEEDLRALQAAAEQYEAVLELEPLHRRALFSLGLLLHDLKRWDDLIALYRRRIAATDHHGEQTTLHLYSAEVLSEHKKDDNAAFVEVMAAARLAPQNIRIIGRLEKLGASTNRHAEVAVTIGDLILNQEDPKVRAALSLRLAELHLGPLGDETRALSYLRAALADDGGNPDILQEMEDVFRERDRFDELAQLLEVCAEDRRIGPHRVRLERELARIYELQLDDAPRALLAVRRAVLHAPDDRELLDEVMRLGLIIGDLAAVAENYEQVLELTDNALLQNYLLLKLGHIYGNVLSRTEDAVRVYWSILEHEPSHGEARRRLLRIYERRGDHEEVAGLLEMQLAGQDGDPETLSSLERLVTLYADHVDDPERAVEASRRLLFLDPEHPGARQVMQSHHDNPDGPPAKRQDEAPASPPDAFHAVTDSAVMVGEDESATVFDGEGYGPESETQFADEALSVPKVQVHASAFELQLDDDAPAAPIPSAAMGEEDSDSTIALMDDQVLFESVVEAAQAAPDPEAELEPDAQVPLHAEPELELEPDLEADIEAEVDEEAEAPPPPRPQPMLHSVPPPVPAPGTEEEQAHEPAPFLDSPAPFLQVVAEASEALRQRQSEQGQTHGLAGRLEELRAELQHAEGERAIELLEEQWAITESQEDGPGAFEALTQLAQLDPDVERLDEQMRLGRQLGLWAPLIESVHEACVALGPQVELQFGPQLAEIEEGPLKDPAAAARRLAHLNEISPNGALFGRWLSAMEAAELYDEMVQALLHRSHDETDLREGQLFLQRAVSVLQSELQAPSRAADVVVQYLAEHPEQEGLREQAAELLAESERWTDLVALHTEHMARLEEAERAELRLKIASLQQERLQDIGAAESTLRQGLEERALDEGLLDALWQMLEANARWPELLEVGLRRVEAASQPQQRAQLKKALARVAEEELSDPGLAESLLTEALADDAHDMQSLRQLEGLRRARQDWDGVYDLLELQVGASDEREAQTRALFAMAEIRAESKGDLDGAAELLRQAVALQPQDDACLGYLAQIEERRGDFVGAVDVLRAHAEAVEVSRRAPVHARLGALLSSHFGDLEGARQEYEAVLALEPGHMEAQLALLSIAESEGNFFDAHEYAVKAAEQTEDARPRAELYVRAGQLAESRLGDERRAILAYQAALSADPEDLSTEARLGELFLSRGEPEAAHPHLFRAAQGLSDPQRAVELFVSAGQAADKCDDLEAAQQAYEAALAFNPTERRALDRLSALRLEAEDWARAYDLGAALILHHEKELAPVQRAQVFLRMARAQKGRAEPEAAHRLAKRAYHLDPELRPALEIMADALEANGEPFEAAECLKRVAQLEPSDEARAQTLLRAGRLLQEQAEDPARAAAMLTEAQAAWPAQDEIGQRLAACRTAVNDAPGAAQALEVLAEHRPGRARSDLRTQAAGLLLGAHRERPRARALLESALQGVATHPQARRDLEVVLEFDSDLEALATLWQQTAAALKAPDVPPEDLEGQPAEALASDLLQRTMALYRDRLADPARALEVLEQLMDRDGPGPWQETYARLLDAQLEADGTPDDGRVGQAIQAWSVLVEERPGRVEALERLRDLRLQVGEVHLAQVASDLLGALGQPAPEGRAALVPAEDEAAQPVPPHAQEASPLAGMFERLGYAPLKALQDVLPEAYPKKKELVGPAGLGIHISRPLETAARVLGVPVPLVYVRDEAQLEVTPTFTGEVPALVVSLTKAQGRSEDELRFVFGRALSLLRPRALALSLLPLDVLREALVGLSKLPDPETHSVDAKVAKKRGRALEKALPAEHRAELSVQVGAWLVDPHRASLGQERQAVLRTAERAGLVVGGSLSMALATLSSMNGGRVERSWRLPLIRFAATREYAEMMRRRGG